MPEMRLFAFGLLIMSILLLADDSNAVEPSVATMLNRSVEAGYNILFFITLVFFILILVFIVVILFPVLYFIIIN